MSSNLLEIMEEVTRDENKLVESMIMCLEREEIKPVLRVLRNWGEKPIKEMLKDLNGSTKH